MSFGAGGDVVGRAIIEVAADTTAARAAFAQVKAEAAGLATTMSASTSAAASTGAAAATSMATRIGTSMQKAGTFVSNFGKNLDRVGITMQSMGRTLTTYLTLPIVGLGVVATKMALDWDRAWTRIAAVTNLNTKQIRGMKEEVQRLSQFTGVAPEELADGVYFLASAGLKGKQVMEALKVSARGAAVGLGEFGTVARLVANVLNAYEGSGMKAQEVTDTLVAAIREGTAEPEEFASSMGRLLPIANAAGISFDELAGSLATVSNIGLDVSEGTTAMRGILQALVAPGTAAADAIKSIGLSLTDVRTSLAEEGLLPTLRELEARTKAKFGEGWIDVMRDIIPNIRALTGELALTGQEAQEVNDIFDAVTHSTGDMSEAFKVTAESDAFKFDRAMARLKAGLIELGEAIIPLLTKYVIPAIRDVVEWFDKLSDSQKENLVKWGAIAAAAGPFLLAFGMVFRLVGNIVRVMGLLTSGIGAVVRGIGLISTAAEGAGIAGVAGGGAAGAAGTAGAGGIVGFLTSLTAASKNFMASNPAMGAAAVVEFWEAIQGVVHPYTGPSAAEITVTEGQKIAGTSDVTDAQATELANLDLAVRNVREGMTSADQAWIDFQHNMEIAGFTSQLTRAEFDRMTESTRSGDDALQDYNETILDTDNALVGTTLGVAYMREEFERARGVTEEHLNQVKRMAGTIDNLGGHISATTQAQVGNLLALGDWKGAMELLHPQLSRLLNDVDKLQSSQKRGAEEAAIWAQKQKQGGDAAEEAAGKTDRQTGATKRSGAAAQKAGHDVDGYKNKLDGLPAKKDTKIGTPGMTAAQANAAHLKGLLDGLSGTYNAIINLTLNRAFNTGEPGTGQRVATGGMFHAKEGAMLRAASGMVTQRPQVLVGEGRYKTPFGTGSEAVLPLNDAVLSRLGNAMANAMGRSGQGRGNGLQVTVNVNGVSGAMDEERLARMVSKHLARNMAAAGMWG